MKNLFLLLIQILLFGCGKKQIEQAGLPEEIATAKPGAWEQFSHVGVVGGASTEIGVPGAVENLKGIAFEVDVKKLKLGGGVTKSVWQRFNYRIFVDGIWRTRWVQFGYFVDRFGLGRGFFVYDRTFGDAQIPPTIEYVNEVELQVGSVSRFEMKNIEGTTWWNVLINGVIVFKADLGTEVGSNFPPEAGSRNNVGVFTESRGVFTFNDVLEIYNIEYFKDGRWDKVPYGRTSGEGWNITPIGEAHFLIGGRGYVPSGTLIW